MVVLLMSVYLFVLPEFFTKGWASYREVLERSKTKPCIQLCDLGYHGYISELSLPHFLNCEMKYQEVEVSLCI